MSLTAEERRAVLPVAAGLPAELVAPFLRRVDVVLNGGLRGQGAAWSAATRLLGTYTTPAPTSRPGPRWVRRKSDEPVRTSPRRCRYGRYG